MFKSILTLGLKTAGLLGFLYYGAKLTLFGVFYLLSLMDSQGYAGTDEGYLNHFQTHYSGYSRLVSEAQDLELEWVSAHSFSAPSANLSAPDLKELRASMAELRVERVSLYGDRVEILKYAAGSFTGPYDISRLVYSLSPRFTSFERGHTKVLELPTRSIEEFRKIKSRMPSRINYNVLMQMAKNWYLEKEVIQ